MNLSGCIIYYDAAPLGAFWMTMKSSMERPGVTDGVTFDEP